MGMMSIDVLMPRRSLAGMASSKRTTITLRVASKSAAAIAAAEGITQKQVIFRALKAAGVPVDKSDLEDRTPRRKA